MDDISTVEKIEAYFKEVNCYGKYNYCFTSQREQSVLPVLFGALGAILEVKKNKNVMGYLLNQTEKGICLIPIVVDALNKSKIDKEKYIFINQNEIKNVLIKNEDFSFKRIRIELKNGTKYVLKTPKKIKNIDYHEINLNKFIESYK